MGGKRRPTSDSEQGDSGSESDHKKASSKQKAEKSLGVTSKSSTKTVKTVKKPKFDVPSSSKAPSSGSGKDESVVKVSMNAEGERYIDLGKKKRATVRSFKGKVFVDIREFFGPDDDEKPGKKGISLSPEQWEVLKQSVDTIDSFFADHSKK